MINYACNSLAELHCISMKTICGITGMYFMPKTNLEAHFLNVTNASRMLSIYYLGRIWGVNYIQAPSVKGHIFFFTWTHFLKSSQSLRI